MLFRSSNANAASYLPIYTGNIVSLTGNVITTANVRAGNLIATANIVATANVKGDYFIGTAITAQYADLAERFSADAFYSAGTLVRIGGEKEITQENHVASEVVLGVISTNPAYLMNDIEQITENHPPVVLNGRAPVRVIGPVRKGDRLISAGKGLAKSADKDEITAFNVIGRSLENKYSDDEGIVIAILRING